MGVPGGRRARSDARTLVRCAALCRSLRREIIRPAFLGPAVRRIAPPCLLGYLHTYAEEVKMKPEALFSLVHPSAVPAAVSFSEEHLAPFLSRSAADLLGRYKPVTLRGGLVALRRRCINGKKRTERWSDMCVYNPMTGERTFFSLPPNIGKHYYPQTNGERYVLLTTADGIDCTFMLLAADFSGFADCSCTISVQTMWSDSGGTWGPPTYVGDRVRHRQWLFLEANRPAVVLHGGVICWLSECDEIVTYDVSTSTPGSVMLPVTNSGVSKLHLGKSPEGKLRLLVADGFFVSVWLLSSGDDWELKDVMDTEDQLRLLDPEIPAGRVSLEFRSSGELAGAAVLKVDGYPYRRDAPLIVLDVETGNMQRINDTYWDSLLVEIDLPTQLQAMKST